MKNSPEPPTESSKPTEFIWEYISHAVTFVETTQVKEGVECDVYSFNEDDSQDLAIVRVDAGCKTPRQRILKGIKTVEGYITGSGKLTIESEDGSVKVFEFHSGQVPGIKEVSVDIGRIMQWTASDEGLEFYEICEPPYEDGRFEDLPDA